MSSLEGSGIQDEIDFEWLGKNKSIVQTNFYVGGVGGREKIVDLGFDCSQAFHNYAILWTPSQLVWFIDYKAVRVEYNASSVLPPAKRSKPGAPVPSKAYPSKPAFFYASMWDASSAGNGWWAGNRTTQERWDVPRTARFLSALLFRPSQFRSASPMTAKARSAAHSPPCPVFASSTLEWTPLGRFHRFLGAASLPRRIQRLRRRRHPAARKVLGASRQRRIPPSLSAAARGDNLLPGGALPSADDPQAPQQEHEQRRRRSDGRRVRFDLGDNDDDEARKETNAGDSSSRQRFGLERGGHPLGVQPLGNLFLRSDHNPLKPLRNARDAGLGALRRLPDPILLDIVGRLPAESLCHVGMASRALHVVAHQEELWRALVLESAEGGFEWEASWRWTYVKWRMGARAQAEGEGEGKGGEASREGKGVKRKEKHGEERGVLQYRPPLKVPDFYSDYFFQSWLCTSLALPPAWTTHDNIPRVAATSLSPADFAARFERPGRPVIITGAINHWPALSRWQDRAYLCGAAGDSAFACGPVELSLDQYWRYADGVQEERPLYVFDPRFGEKAPALLGDYEVPEYFREDLFQVLDLGTGGGENGGENGGERGAGGAGGEGGDGGEGSAGGRGKTGETGEVEVGAGEGEGEGEGQGKKEETSGRPDFRWLIMGPARAGSSWHIDPNSTCAWNAVITGSKKWILFPPNEGPPPGVRASPDGADVAAPVSITEWFMNYYEEMRRGPVTAYEGVCAAGEVMFVPHGWWHIVLNLEESIALTQNYVSSANLLDVMRFLQRPNARVLVSGMGEGQREGLHDRFRECLAVHRPGLLEREERDEEERELRRKQKAAFWEQAANAGDGGFRFGF
ncbi:unnamed protein product [Closterium sp. Naga37s-1]|nr:unnamed protein product [Closterium sp. Naga37s-1]CAI5522308.1 unnamed protein product [Closterium sp. Naga37s-1]